MARNYFSSVEILESFSKIKPNYEFFYDDLKTLDIGSFLLTREFKILMVENDFYELWNKILLDVENTRRTLSLITDQKKSDLEKVLISFINKLDVIEVQNIITKIIEGFISNNAITRNYDLIKKDIKILKFSFENIAIIEEVIEKKHINQIQNISILEADNSNTMSEIKRDKIFIVHGHDNYLKVEVARILEKLKLQPIILHEQSNNGKTIIEKFEKFSDVSFAVILLTADDLGNSRGIEQLNKRARQNVIFELGYFIGKLGRENVMTLKEEDVEVPNDISGVVYTLYDSQGNWKYELGKELKSAGFEIDMNNLFN